MAIDLLQIQDYIVLIVYTVLMALIGAIYGFMVRESGAYIKGSGAIPWPGCLAKTPCRPHPGQSFSNRRGWHCRPAVR